LPWILAAGLLPFRWLHLLRSLDPPASPFALTRVASSQRPILSWVSAPLELSPSTPRILRPARSTRLRTCPLTRRLRDTTQGTLRPPSPGETVPIRKHRDNLVGRFWSPSRPARATSRWRSYSLGLGAPGKPFTPDPRSLEVRRKRRFSEEMPALLGFLASSASS
jgi:hypothetical protein